MTEIDNTHADLTHNYAYSEIPTLIIYYISRRNRSYRTTCMEFTTKLQLLIILQWANSSMDT